MGGCEVNRSIFRRHRHYKLEITIKKQVEVLMK